MSGFPALLKRELRSITREKTIMFAVMVQFFIASFSSVILVGIMAFYDPSSIGDNTRVHIRVGLPYDENNRFWQTEDMGILMDYLLKSGARPEFCADMTQAESKFLKGRVDAILVAEQEPSGVVDMKLTMPEMDTRKTVIFMVLDKPLKQFENYLRAQRGVELRYDSTDSEPSTTYEFLYTLIIPILMLFPALIAGSIVIDTVSEEFENKTFDTLAAAPVSLAQVVGSKMSAALITAAVQVVLWVGLLRLNDIIILNAFPVILLSLVVAGLVTVLTAFLALYFKDRERTQFVYSISLVLLIGGSYFLDPSPFGLITRLAAGDPTTGMWQVGLYALPLLAAGALFFRLSRRLVLAKR